MTDIEMRRALGAILDTASAALRAEIPGGGPAKGAPGTEAHDGHGAHDHADPGCTLRSLPERLWTTAAQTATRLYPANSPYLSMLGALPPGVMPAMRLAVLTTKYWGPKPRRMSVSFMDNPPADLRRRILEHMNAWSRTAAITFAETAGVGTVRIARAADGYWSYLGSDVLHIPADRPTMNLQGFTMQTPEAEYRRVVRHETGHTMGFPHEHMRRELVARIDPQKAYDFFWRTYGWDRPTVDAQVLQALDDQSIMGTPSDQTSIMCYQLPGAITFDGLPIVGGLDINATDYAFAGKIYPRLSGHAGGAHAAHDARGSDWDPADDVTPDLDALAA